LEYSQIFGRFVDLPEQIEAGRAAVYVATLALWRDFPLFGVGVGNFQDIFPLYQPAAVGQVFYDYAHNDYLQLLAETGILGFAFLMWAFSSVLYAAGRFWHKAMGEQRVWLAGVLAGVVAMALHSLVDFNVHIPANALLFVTLLALSVRLGVLAPVPDLALAKG
jgi:O-antigen ligase